MAFLALSGAFFKLMRDYIWDKNKYATAVVDSSKTYVKTAK